MGWVPLGQVGHRGVHDTGCLGLVHWDDPEGWYGEGGFNASRGPSPLPPQVHLHLPEILATLM